MMKTQRKFACIRRSILRLSDPKRLDEITGKRIVFHHLQSKGFLDGLEGKRILEIGPKHGKDTMLLASLNPSELVLIDLPSKASMSQGWLEDVPCKTTYVSNNLLYMTEDQIAQIGTFDLIFCLGVLYHNAEQLRLLYRLLRLCNENGRVVIESATTRNRKLESLNVVEIHWPTLYRESTSMTHLPSRLAIKSWLEMVGFVDLEILDCFSKKIASQRACITGVKNSDGTSFAYYKSDKNPAYFVGNAE